MVRDQRVLSISVVRPRPREKWGEAVKAVGVLKPDRTVAESEIIESCKANLAGFKCPEFVDFVEALPKTGSGKI